MKNVMFVGESHCSPSEALLRYEVLKELRARDEKIDVLIEDLDVLERFYKEVRQELIVKTKKYSPELTYSDFFKQIIKIEKEVKTECGSGAEKSSSVGGPRLAEGEEFYAPQSLKTTEELVPLWNKMYLNPKEYNRHCVILYQLAYIAHAQSREGFDVGSMFIPRSPQLDRDVKYFNEISSISCVRDIYNLNMEREKYLFATLDLLHNNPGQLSLSPLNYPNTYSIFDSKRDDEMHDVIREKLKSCDNVVVFCGHAHVAPLMHRIELEYRDKKVDKAGVTMLGCISSDSAAMLKEAGYNVPYLEGSDEGATDSLSRAAKRISKSFIASKVASDEAEIAPTGAPLKMAAVSKMAASGGMGFKREG